MLPLLLVLLGLHTPPGERSLNTESPSQGRHVITVLPAVRPEESSLAHANAPDPRSARPDNWITGLPIQVDVRDGGVCVALKLRSP